MSGFTHEPPVGGSPEWYTPPDIFRALGLEFDLDPCAPRLPAASWIPARKRYSLPVDGLTEPWFGRVWLNPPYADQTQRWVGRLVDHGDGVALTFARVDTPWWQAAASAASLVCMIAGRLEYIPGDPSFRRRSRSGAPSSLLAFGSECADALAESRLGMCFVPELLEAIALPLVGIRNRTSAETESCG